MIHRKLLRMEYRRMLRSGWTAALVGTILLLTGWSYGFSWALKQELLEQLRSPAEDLDVEALERWLGSLDGFSFFFDYYRLSDWFQLGTLALYGWLGVFVSGHMPMQRQNGQGNALVVPMGFPRYARTMLAAQCLYLATVLFAIFGLQLTAALVLGGVGTTDLADAWCKIVGLYAVTLFYSLCVHGITTASMAFVHHVTALQAIPFFGFGLLPMVVCAALSNVTGFGANLSELLVPSMYLSVPVTGGVSPWFYGSLALFGLGAVLGLGVCIGKLERNYI